MYVRYLTCKNKKDTKKLHLCNFTKLVKLPASLQLCEAPTESPNRRRRTIKSSGGEGDLAVVIQDNNEIGIRVAGIVHCFVCLSCSHGSIADHCNYMVVFAQQISTNSHSCFIINLI